MEGHHFDTFSRWLATRDSRRATLRGLAVGTLAVALGHLRPVAVVAGCQRPGQKCDSNRDCCDGAECSKKRDKCVCKRGTTLCGNGCCSRGQVCAEGGKEPPTCCAPANVCGPLCCPPDRVCVGSAANPLDPNPDPNTLYRCICPDGFEEDADGNCGCPHVCGDDCCEAEDGEVCCSRGRWPQILFPALLERPQLWRMRPQVSQGPHLPGRAVRLRLSHGRVRRKMRQSQRRP